MFPPSIVQMGGFKSVEKKKEGNAINFHGLLADK